VRERQREREREREREKKIKEAVPMEPCMSLWAVWHSLTLAAAWWVVCQLEKH
jgi:hypothetical protein